MRDITIENAPVGSTVKLLSAGYLAVPYGTNVVIDTWHDDYIGFTFRRVSHYCKAGDFKLVTRAEPKKYLGKVVLTILTIITVTAWLT